MGRIFREFFESWLRPLGGPIGRKLRIWYYRKRLKACGENCVIEEGVYITNPHLITFGNNVWIDKNTILVAGAFDKNSRQFKEKGNKQIPWGELHIGEGCHIAPFSLIQAHGGVQIGNNVTVASGAKIYSLSHHYRNLNDKRDQKRYSFSSTAPLKDQFMIVGNVRIGDNAAIGVNAVILPGTTIPEGTWIGVLCSPKPGEILTKNEIYTSK